MARELSDLHDDLQRITGNKGLSDAVMTRLLNDALLEICGGVNLEELQTVDDSQTTADGTEAYNVPSDSWLIDSVSDSTNDYLLEFLLLGEFYRRRSTDADDEDEPKFWTRRGSYILLSPIPDDAYSLLIVYREAPTLMSADDDTIGIDEVWEPAVLYLAAANAFMTFDEDSRAALWLQRTVTYLQSRSSTSESYLAALNKGLDALRAEVS